MSTPADASVLARVRGGVLHVTINRPEKLNALNHDALDGLRYVFESAAREPSIHIAVLRGAGDRSFAAGGDLQEFGTLRSTTEAAGLYDEAAAALDAIRALPVPVVAALNGMALGGGAELAVACDFRLAAAHARVGFVHSTLAITTGFSGAGDLVALLGRARAMRLLAAGEVLSASHATVAGLIDEVCATDETLDELIARFIQPFLARPVHVIRALKSVASADRHGRSGATRQAERDAFVETWTSPAHWAAVDALFARKP